MFCWEDNGVLVILQVNSSSSFDSIPDSIFEGQIH